MLEKGRDTLQVYMESISAIPLLSIEDENRLASQIKAGNQEARKKMIEANLRLVVKIAHDFKGMGLPMSDLIAEGNIGLMKAVDKFDPSRGAKLSSYAAWWIKQCMRRALSNQSKVVRVPVQTVQKNRRVQQITQEYVKEFGRQPTIEELASLTGFSQKCIQRLRSVQPNIVSLNEPIVPDGDKEMAEVVHDEQEPTVVDNLADSETMQRLVTLTEQLPEREREILTLRFGLDGSVPMTLEMVSARIRRTRERVRQLQNQALNKLKLLLDGEDMPMVDSAPAGAD